jgi:hypothetical protein
MSVVADRVSRYKISDPKPAHCAACYGSAGVGVRFIDFDTEMNRGAIVQEGTMAVLDSIDELHLCEVCIMEAAEELDYKPGLHARHLQLNRELMRERDELRAENAKLRELL